MHRFITWVGLLSALLTSTVLTAGPAFALPSATPANAEPEVPAWVFGVGAIAAVAVVAFWSVRRRP
ncbi:hypothetical protein A5645_12175 [Mycobacterium asiaticum]|uniref:hypothetical protein n=1 Tax=Mycobacterium asiaticum TaxID=1790 RepID=UPI0007EF2871|nr:hypothetical protein [Mycobacterium asiaticum]OBK95708.1 hypothetical protein A5645_12175 [Mycobacterium asiaticum]